MKKTLLAALLATAFSAPVIAQTTSAPEAAPAPALTGNLGLFSSYRFRGIDQTFGKAALQGGVDYAHASGLYLGNWNSNVSSGAGFPDGNLEMDFYGGYKTTVGDFGLDTGAIVYYYPGSQGSVLGTGAASGPVTNKEIYIGGSWKFLSLKYNYSIDDYFSLRGWDATGTSTGQSTRGTSYLDLSANYDLGNGWGVNGHVGHLDLKNGYKGNYTDWKLGATKDFDGWVVGLSYLAANAAGKCSGASDYQFYCFSSMNSEKNGVLDNNPSKLKDAGRATAVLSVTRAF